MPNPLYPTTTVEKAKKHILACIPVGHKNQMAGLLATLENSVLAESKNQSSQEDNSCQQQ